MKTKLVLAFVLTCAMVTSSSIFSQEKVEGYGMAEITYMLPKIGMEKAFEKAVIAHNDKYHKEGPFAANLDLILTGEETGWYVWVMGPCTFTDLDNRPENDAHSADWTKTVSPLVAQYGRNEYWKLNSSISNPPKDTPKYETIWFMEIKKGEYYRYKDLMEKIKKVHDKHEDYYSIYENQFREDNARDVATVWPNNSWAEFDEKSGIKKKYEDMYGSGSWDNFLTDWRAVVVTLKSQVWKINVK